MNRTVVELFAGVGGFRVGLNNITSINEDGTAAENGDWDFVWANQWEPSTKAQPAFECYCARFGSANHVNSNIQEIDKELIPDHSLLVGGFPCQDYSVARSISGEKGIEGKKGVLFWEIADILTKKNTPFVLLENVDRLLKSPSSQRGRDFGIMLRTFNDAGYNVEWRVINAAEYGARQRRRRIFIFAWLKTLNYNKTLKSCEDTMFQDGLFAKSFPTSQERHIMREVNITKDYFTDTVAMTELFKMNFENSGCMINGTVKTTKLAPVLEKGIPLSATLQTNVPTNYNLTDQQIEKFTYLKGGKRINRVRPNGEPYIYSEGPVCFPEPLDSPSRTMLTSEGTVNRSTHVVENPNTNKLRFITSVEAERLQHFPDNWTNSGMTERQRYFMMGNALVTHIIKRLEPVLNNIVHNE